MAHITTGVTTFCVRKPTFSWKVFWVFLDESTSLSRADLWSPEQLILRALLQLFLAKLGHQQMDSGF
jgi:hypothetical protein